MSGLFPIRKSVELDESREPRLVNLDEDVADEVFSALASSTTRQIFGQLHESPQTASDLATVTDTSVQNVQYHLKKLNDADLVEVVDTWYSERGTEMKVYAPTDESLVLFAGRDERKSLRRLLRDVLGMVALLLPVSAAAGWLVTRLGESGEGPSGLGAGDDVSIQSAAERVPDGAAELFWGIDPALVAGGAFFLGGLFVLVVSLVLYRYRT